MALEGSSTDLRSAINAENGGADPNPEIPDQAHHLLSSSVVIELDYQYRKEAKKLMARAADYQLNDASNGILMPTHFGHQKELDLPRHRGNHWDEYYANVKRILKPLYIKYKTLDVCKPPAQTEFLAELKTKEGTVRSNIKKPSWWLYEWSKDLWTKDYRDEGVGNLKRDGRPVTAADVGMEWVKKKVNSGEPKRRFLEEVANGKKKNVVRKAWYAKHTYPVPGDDDLY